MILRYCVLRSVARAGLRVAGGCGLLLLRCFQKASGWLQHPRHVSLRPPRLCYKQLEARDSAMQHLRQHNSTFWCRTFTKTDSTVYGVVDRQMARWVESPERFE